MRVLLQTSRQLAPPTNSSVKSAQCGEGERPWASFGPLAGQGESTAFPTNPQFMAETDRSNTQYVKNLVTGPCHFHSFFKRLLEKYSFHAGE